ncbi:MAG: HEAT repeat domain-containing protein [Xenococcaceae cyanobacterium MO_188.B32]|nr:HEAT repeat domain-containing protein [Xenococcaceae cyanobacterium MO_188.B32]
MTIDSLFEQLKHPNPNLRERAMVEIARQRDENTIPRLMSNLGQEDVVYRRACVKTLGVIGFDAIPFLVEALNKNDNVTFKASCVKALANVAVNYPDEPFPTEGIEGLKNAMNNSNPVVYIAAVMALGAIGSPVLDILIENLKNTDNPAVAVAIINALSSIGDKQGEEILKTISQDESADEYVRESATSALSRLEMVMKYNQSS